MREEDAAAMIQDAIDYILLVRESCHEDDGELTLVRNLEQVIDFIRSREVKQGHGRRLPG